MYTDNISFVLNFSHRNDLAFKAIMSKVTSFNKLELMINKIFSYYNSSHKRFYDLLDYAEQIGATVLKLAKIFKVRYMLLPFGKSQRRL